MSGLVPYGGNGQLVTGDLGGVVDALAGRLSPSTVEQYREAWAMYATWAGRRGLAVGDAETLRAWRDYMVSETRLSPNTLNIRLSAVKRVVLEGARRGVVDLALADRFRLVEGVRLRAMRDRLKVDARTMIPPDDMRRICEAPDPATLPGLRDQALLFAMAATGCRIAEILAVKVSDIRRRGRRWVVMVTGKTDVVPRAAPLTAEAKAKVDAWLAARGPVSEYVFTGFQGRSLRRLSTPISPKSAWEAVKDAADLAGVEGVSTHDYRRFVATRLTKQGDIRKAQKVLGHADIASTARYDLSELEGDETEGLF